MEPLEFSFTDEEFLSIINQICEKETPMGMPFVPLESMNDSINADRLDSLGMIIFFVWLAEMFEIDDESITEFTEQEVFTVAALKEFVRDNATQTYSYATYKELTDKCF